MGISEVQCNLGSNFLWWHLYYLMNWERYSSGDHTWESAEKYSNISEKSCIPSSPLSETWPEYSSSAQNIITEGWCHNSQPYGYYSHMYKHAKGSSMKQSLNFQLSSCKIYTIARLTTNTSWRYKISSYILSDHIYQAVSETPGSWSRSFHSSQLPKLGYFSTSAFIAVLIDV